MNIAIIGTGISGNVAAYHLNKYHNISVFEANDYIGGHTNTHDIVWSDNISHTSRYAIDTGFIVFNEATYPNFIKLLEDLNVDFLPTSMSFSVKSEKNGLEYNGNSLNTLFAQRTNLLSLSFHRMIKDILRFNREAPLSLQYGDAEVGLAEYLKRGGYSQMFIEHYIIPMGAAIWSTDPKQMQSFPAHFFIRFFYNHGLLNVTNRPQWYVIKGGSKQYIAPLTRPFKEQIHLNTPIEWIRRYPSYVAIKPQNREAEYFDAVFIATHSDQALRMLADPSRDEKEVLGAIKYQANEAVLHTDESILPNSKRAWAAWNYHILDNQQERVAVTYNMNILQGLDAPVQFCVTLNNSRAIKKSKIIKTIQYQHPLYTPDSIAAQQRQKEINGVNRTYFCGAYWRNGFHEDGVVSALNAIKHFDEYEYEQLHLRRAS